MATDALDPGDGTYPFFPRRPDGSPYWSDRPEDDGIPLAGPDGIPHAPMPRGIRVLLRTNRDRVVERIAVDVTPYAGSAPVDPPVLP